jgi:hypothetical protein
LEVHGCVSVKPSCVARPKYPWRPCVVLISTFPSCPLLTCLMLSFRLVQPTSHTSTIHSALLFIRGASSGSTCEAICIWGFEKESVYRTVAIRARMVPAKCWIYAVLLLRPAMALFVWSWQSAARSFRWKGIFVCGFAFGAGSGPLRVPAVATNV